MSLNNDSVLKLTAAINQLSEVLMGFPHGGGGGTVNIPFTGLGQLAVGGAGGTTTIFNPGANGQALVAQSGALNGMSWENRIHSFVYNIPGGLAVGTGINRLPIPNPSISYTILGAYAMINTAPTGASVIFDVLKNATTIYTGGTNRPAIPAGSNVSQNYVAPAVTTLAVGDFLTVNIAQVGSSITGSDATLVILLAETD